MDKRYELRSMWRKRRIYPWYTDKGASKRRRVRFIGRGDGYEFVYAKNAFRWECGRTGIMLGFTGCWRSIGYAT